VILLLLALWATYETWKAQVRAWATPRREVRPNPLRKLLHLSLIAVAAVPLWFQRDPWVTPVVWALGFLIGRFIFPLPALRGIQWCDESTGAPCPEVGVLAFPTVMLWTTLLLPVEAGLVLLAFLAVGDGLASLIGRPLGHIHLPWNAQKSWAGFLAFVLGGGGTALWLLELAEQGGAKVGAGPVPVLALVLAAAESWPSRWDDNLRLGATLAVVWFLVRALFP